MDDQRREKGAGRAKTSAKKSMVGRRDRAFRRARSRTEGVRKEERRTIAKSLKRSAESSDRRKTSAFRSAMSMLTFYMNRAGRNLPTERKRTLETAKERLRELFGRNP
jgi:hypothetical protein